MVFSDPVPWKEVVVDYFMNLQFLFWTVCYFKNVRLVLNPSRNPFPKVFDVGLFVHRLNPSRTHDREDSSTRLFYSVPTL